MSYTTELVLTAIWAIGAIATMIKQTIRDKKEIDEIIRKCEENEKDHTE